MLTNNLWQQVGLCNGARGIVESLLYLEGQKPPNLPIAMAWSTSKITEVHHLFLPSPIVFLYHQ